MKILFNEAKTRHVDEFSKILDILNEENSESEK